VVGRGWYHLYLRYKSTTMLVRVVWAVGGGWTQLLVLPSVQSTLRPLKLHQLWSGTVGIVHVAVDDTRVVPIWCTF